MVKMTVRIEGMACSMCEAHVNDAVRRTFNVQKVASSHRKKQTEIIAEEAICEEKLISAIEATGYQVLGIETAAYEKKKGLFSFLSR